MELGEWVWRWIIENSDNRGSTVFYFNTHNLTAWPWKHKGSYWTQRQKHGKIQWKFGNFIGTVNDLFSAQCAKKDNIWWENSPFSAPIMKHFPGWSIGQSGKNNCVSTFRIYQKYPLPVNMAVDKNKLESHDKNVNLLSKNTCSI